MKLTIPTLLALANLFFGLIQADGHLGEECWLQCGKKTGYCPQFCGSGLCCRHGFTDNGCNGNMGNPGNHVCVKYPDDDDDGHLGEECWLQCGKKTGYCPQFCGSG